MSDERHKGDPGDEPRRLHEVGAEDRAPVDREAEDLVRATAAMAELDAADNEALLALTLGDEVSDISDDERRAADALAVALDAEMACADPLVSLAWSLRAVAGAETAELAEADNEALLSLALGTDVAVSADERQQANALRDRLDPAGAGDPLVASLRALHAPAAIDGADHEMLLALSLGEEVSAIDEREQAEAERLAEAMDDGGSAPLMGLVGSLRALRADRTLDRFTVERLLRRVLPKSGAAAGPAGGRRPMSRNMTLGALVAMAAGVALFIGSMSGLGTDPVAGRDVPHAQAGLVASFIEARSTQELFDPAEPFARKGGESDRIGSIVSARAGDLRSNRFAAWGVE